MRELVELIAKALVDHPDEVVVTHVKAAASREDIRVDVDID